jgi:hypothetical protein
MTRSKIAALFIALLAIVVTQGLPAPAGRASSYPWPGGHDTAGVEVPSDTWYFAEGCTRDGFDCWLCVMNPQETPADLEVSFLTPAGMEFQKKNLIPPLSRYTMNVADVVGEGQDVSMVVKSSIPVVAERPMYFAYHGPSRPGVYVLAQRYRYLLHERGRRPRPHTGQPHALNLRSNDCIA